MLEKIKIFFKEKFSEVHFGILVAIITVVSAWAAGFIGNTYLDITSAKFINLAIFSIATTVGSLSFRTFGFDIYKEIIDNRNLPLAVVEAARIIGTALCTVL